MPEIKKTGAQLIAVSPMLAKYTPQLVNKLGLGFPVLSDPGNKAMEQLGVVHRLPDELIEVYKGFGIDIERYNGDTDWRLPLPGNIIIDSSGEVRNVALTTDHTERSEPSDTLELLRRL